MGKRRRGRENSAEGSLRNETAPEILKGLGLTPQDATAFFLYYATACSEGKNRVDAFHAAVLARKDGSDLATFFGVLGLGVFAGVSYDRLAKTDIEGGNQHAGG